MKDSEFIRMRLHEGQEGASQGLRALRPMSRLLARVRRHAR